MLRLRKTKTMGNARNNTFIATNKQSYYFIKVARSINLKHVSRCKHCHTLENGYKYKSFTLGLRASEFSTPGAHRPESLRRLSEHISR
jgi:hypothetical protein